jgi:hypothetical protein
VKRTLALVAVAAIAFSASAANASTHPTLDSVDGWGKYANPPSGGPFWGPNGWSPDDTTTATPTRTMTFTLTGSVAKDCSYYAGSSNTHTINLGAIGLNNGDTETTSTAFTQAGEIQVEMTSTSAGCNFNNTVTATKAAAGLVNPAPGGYDSSEFTANIPYTLRVGVAKAVDYNTVGTGIYHGFDMTTSQTTGSMHLGAWRSNLTLRANMPVQSRGLVAGTYSDTITLTLAVDVS